MSLGYVRFGMARVARSNRPWEQRSGAIRSLTNRNCHFIGKIRSRLKKPRLEKCKVGDICIIWLPFP